MEEVERRGDTFEATRPLKVSDDRTPYDEATMRVFEALTRAERITDALIEKLAPLIDDRERADAQLREIQPDRLDVQILRPLHEYADRLATLADRIAAVKDRLVI